MESEIALKNLEDFFELDLQIKEKIYKLAPSELNNSDDVIKYMDLLYNSLNGLEKKLLEIGLMFDFQDGVIAAISETLNRYRERIAHSNYSANDARLIYNECFAAMTEKTLNMMKENIFGDATIYYIGPDEVERERKLGGVVFEDVILKSTSVNELLHVLHFYIVNNIKLLRDIPSLDSKISEEEEQPIVLRGIPNEIALNIYDSFDTKIDVGQTDIVAVSNDKVLVMVRDRGHALSMEVEVKGDAIGVYYFIPGACKNPQMVSNLKGITNYDGSTRFASGSFLTSKEMIGKDVIGVVEGTPTDQMNLQWLSYEKSQTL